MCKIDTEQLENVIVGYAEPHIYAFTTGTIPKYTKVGDTIRPVSVRLNEWKEKFPDLKELDDNWSAKINNDLYFRDYSVHKYLEDTLNKHRLTQEENPADYFSNEFFKDTEKEDIDNAIDHIQKNQTIYDLYDIKDKGIVKHQYRRSESKWNPRPNQKDTVKNFVNAVNSDRNKLLMYAVMRFGKSFTSLLCAKKMGYKFIIVVSAKADVKEEWKKNVEIPGNFVGYNFIDSESLIKNENILDNINKDNRYVLFLTLQDLRGNKIKEKHKAIFKNNKKLDLVIVDETHFGARGKSYGEVLKCDDNSTEDYEDFETCDKEIKKLNPKVFLHLSGTPYRILMSNEFSEEDIIASFKYSDIIKEQEKWNKENLENNEWDNPYFGFPQMIRFALNPNKSSVKLLNRLKEEGKTYSLSALFETESIKKDTKNNNHTKFKHEKEVLDLFKLIDGSEEEEDFFGFLNYNKLKDGQMCRHIVCALPFRASCDALEQLLKEHKDEFKNLKNYEIINVAGHNAGSKKINAIKNKIYKFDNENTKTISLTCNKMLTGTTVPQWDTMLFLKETKSPQEYDQAIYRIQNQNIVTYQTEDGKIIKINKKPQTLLVDFSPVRMFSFKENEAFVYGMLNKQTAYEKIEEELKKETEISPIFVINSNKVQQVTSVDIIDKIRNYSKDRGVFEELNEIGIDLNIKENTALFNIINKENEIDSKNGFNTAAYEGETTDIDQGNTEENSQNTQDNNSGNTKETEPKENDEKSFAKKIQAYHAKLLFYAFLTEDKVKSINDIIKSLEKEKNKRIFKNIGLNINDLKIIYDYYQKNNSFVLKELEYKINNINNLANDISVSPIERAKTALYKFNRLGESEIVTPLKISKDMVNLLPEDMFTDCNKKFLDIASKEGEFAIAIADRYVENNIDISQIKDCIYSIPTSGLTYEFTRKVYNLLGLNTDNIAKEFTSYDLLEVKKKVKNKEVIDYEKVRKIICQNKKFSEITIKDDVENIEEKDMIQFDAVVGNPPYQLTTGTNTQQAVPLYNYFVSNAIKMNPKYVSLIMPARWYSGGFSSLKNFRINFLNDKRIEYLYDFPNPKEVFNGVDIAGGVCYFLWNKNKNTSKCKVINVSNGIRTESNRELNKYKTFVRDNNGLNIIEKVFRIENTKKTLENIVAPQNPFGLSTNYKPCDKGISCFFIQKIGKKCANTKDVKDDNNLLNKWKLLLPKAPIAGQTDFTKPIGFYYDGNTYIAEPGSCCTESFIVGGAFDTEEEVNNYKSYIFTKIVRFLLLQTVISQDVLRNKFCYIPALEKYDIQYTDDILRKRWNITDDEWEYINSKIHNYEKNR